MTVLPMFPLGTVLVPSALLPLHVFEPRYRQLVADVLAADVPELGIVMIERGSEVGGGDVRSDLGTVARIVEAHELPDGRWAVVVVGARRIRVRRWLPDEPYPKAEVEDWPDPAPGPDHAALLASVVVAMRRSLALASELGESTVPATVELADDPVLAGYQVVAAAPLGPFDRQQLLGAPDPDARVQHLATLLAEAVEVLEARLAGD